jgi:ADP-ribose pyrophosphatase YjhB (NUDIX family)
MNKNEKWLEWAIELQSLAQAGLTYGKDVYDRERYERIRDISAEILSYKTDISVEKVKNLFCNEVGYQTPKLDTRAAVFEHEKILLVKENNGKWSLPGGWVDVNLSVKENTVKEVKEESGLDVTADRIIAIQDRDRHNLPAYAYGVCKIFVLCSVLGGEFEKNIETTEFRYFNKAELPELATEKNTKEQIEMCFNAYYNKDWIVEFD